MVEGVAIAILLFNLAMVAYSFRGDWLWSAEDDVRQNLFPFLRAQEPNLFPNDLIAVHAMAFQPEGYKLVFGLATRLVDVHVASKLVAIGLAVANVALFCWVASILFRARSRMFWITLVFATGNAFMWFLSLAGMPRSFALPLSLLAFVAFLRPGRVLFVGTAVLAALFSPTILIFLGVLAPFKLLEDGLVAVRPTPRIEWRPVSGLALALLLCVGFVAVGQRSVKAQLGPTAVYAEWQSNPAFQPGGRWAGERLRSLQEDLWILRDRAIPLPDDRLRIMLFAVLLAAGAVAVFRGVRGRDRHDGPEWRGLRAFTAFFVAGLIARGVAEAIALKLYLPDRLLIPVVPAAFFALLATTSLLIRWAWDEPRFQFGPVKWGLAGGTAALFILAFSTGGVRRPSARRAMNIHVGSADQELLTYIRREVPKNALVAGNPVALDNVPLFARRSVLVNWETSLPLYPRYYSEITRRTLALIPAYFTQARSDVEEFRREMNVTHMVVRLSDFRDDARPWTGDFVHGPAYILPFTPVLQRRISARAKEQPWLWETLDADPAVVFRNAEYLVVDLARLSADPGLRGLSRGNP